MDAQPVPASHPCPPGEWTVKKDRAPGHLTTCCQAALKKRWPMYHVEPNYRVVGLGVDRTLS
eukprot:3095122-Amphidinium_carterae.2